MSIQFDQIKGVIFDMDGVLVDSEPLICESAVKMFESLYKIEVQAKDFEPFVGTGEDRYVGGVAEQYGVQHDPAAAKAETYRIYLDIIKGRLEPLPGVKEFVAQCKEMGRKIAVASSADRIKVDGNLSEIGLPTEEFDAVVCGDDVEHKKPAPDIFLLAAKKLGLDAKDCLVVEDAPSGAQAAKAAGAFCLGITSSFSDETLREAGADEIATHLEDAKKVLG